MLYWRNCKIKVIVALCIVGLLGFIILIIVQKAKSTNTT
jgi:preprotein translocase subunit Sss1